MRVELLGRDDADCIAAAWDELAAHALEPNPFYERWLLLPAMEAFDPEGAVRLLAVLEGSRLIVLMPVRRTGRLKGFPVSTLAGWRHRHCLLGTPLVRASRNAPRALGALLDWMAGAPEGAAALELRYVAAGGAVTAALTEALAERGLTAVAADVYGRPLLRRAANAEACLAAWISRDSLRTNARKEKQLAAQGRLDYRTLGAQDDAAAWIEDFMKLEALGWKGAAGSALACRPADRGFARRVLAEASARGRLMMSGIDLDGRPIARLLGITCGEGAIAFKTAYDEAFRAFTPGVLAEVHNIRKFHARAALQWMDSFTAPGNTLMARIWKDRLVTQTLLVGLRWPGRIAAAAYPLSSLAKQAAARLAQRLRTIVSEATTSATPASIGSVTASSRKSHPHSTPSTGMPKPTVMVREGPMSRISVKNAR